MSEVLLRLVPLETDPHYSDVLLLLISPSLEEARRATPVFGKAEYALKRLLWLGS